MAVDMDRKNEDWRERVWGYTGAGGLVQGFAAGYFLWDLWICTTNVGVFGWGMLAHAVAALVVFSLGFVCFPNTNQRTTYTHWTNELVAKGC